MRQKLLLLLSLLLWGFNTNVVLADDQPNVTVVEDIDKYEGTDPYVFNQADGKVYVLNNVGDYERYGVYERVSTLKVAGGGDTEIEYIETTPDMAVIPYINTGYVHKANTRIVAEVNITDNSVRNYEAIFGSRAGYGNQMFVFFWRFNQDNAGCFARNAEVRGAQLIPTGEKVIVDASGVELNVFYPDDEEPAATITGEGEPAGGSTPMYIFDLCHGDHIDNSQAYFKLYSFKIYEGDELVMDLKPFVSSTGDAGLIDKVGGKKFFSGNSGKFVVSPDGQAAVSAAGVTVYEGKMVFNTSDSKLYKYTGGQFKAIGERTSKPIEFTDYKNMNNWQTNDGHKSVFWPSDGRSIIEYDANDDANYIDNYSGIGGYEPLMVRIPVEEGEDYNFMFDYVGCAYNSWHNVPMHIFVTNKYDLGTTEAGLAPGGDVLATFECPFDGTDGEKIHVSLDFTAQQDNQTIVAQFGDCDDGANFWFEFYQLTVSKYVYPENYPALNPFGPQIELLIPEIEAYKGNTLPALKTALDAAVAEAKASLKSEDLGVQKAALDNLKSAYQAVKDNDITLLQTIMALAKADGVDVTEYEAFCEEGVAGTADQVDRLRVERKVAHLEKDYKSDWKGHTPAEGDFYLYNVGTGAYLTSGSDWGTHAAVGYPGLVATLIPAEGGYNLQFLELIPGDARDRFFGGSPYVDCADGAKGVYSFEPVDGKPGVYNIHGDRGYLAFDPTGNTDTGRKFYNTVTGEWATPDNEMAEWILVTKEDRLADLDNATEENPVDVTVLIRDASFNKFAALDDPWLGINQGWGWGDAGFGDKNTETWNTQEYELSQTVTFPRRGVYEVAVQAYYRDGNFGDHVASIVNGETLVEAPVFFANDKTTPLCYIHTAADKAPGEGDNSEIGNMPNSMYQASLFFENGLYWNRMRISVDEDNTDVVLGIRKEAGNRDGNWIVADNFRAVYLGPNADPDGVAGVAAVPVETQVIYDLAGRRLAKPVKGVNIINHQKVVVK